MVEETCNDDICKDCHAKDPEDGRTWNQCLRYHLFCFKCANYNEKCKEMNNEIYLVEDEHGGIPITKEQANCNYISMDEPEDIKDELNTKWIKMEIDNPNPHVHGFYMETREIFEKIIKENTKLEWKDRNANPYRKMSNGDKVLVFCKVCKKVIYPSKELYCSKECQVVDEL